MSIPPPATAIADVAGRATMTEDLGPLAWVLTEIQKSLEGAGKLLRRFAREIGSTPDLDAGPLRLARQQLHQAVGALQMVGHPAPARVLGAMEFAVQSFVLEPGRCTEDAVHKIERAGFAVADFLQALLAGKSSSPIALFPQYREVLELVGNERVHPADLWPHVWQWADLPRPATATALVYDPAVRSKLDREVLKVVRDGDDVAARRLHELCLGLARGASHHRPAATFWTLAAGFFEALSLSLVPADVYAKRAASRVLLQYATLARGDRAVSDRLAQDLLFFCAQAVPGSRDAASTLRAVRVAWGLADARPVDYTSQQFGRFDPAVLAQARKRIETAKELWSALSGGDLGRLRQTADTFAQLAESLQKLHPASLPMAQALSRAVDASMRSNQRPGTELAMEVATSVLYLEAAFEDLDPHDRQLTARTVQLAGRIERARESGRSEPLEPWMEDLYRRVSDRQSMGTVVDELRVHLSELEKALDQFFRRPGEKNLLRDVPSQLLQMRGVFSVLGLDQAARTVQHMRDAVDGLLQAPTAPDAASDFDSLGNNLGALGFLIDMLGYQPALAKRLFVFDEPSGELKPLMGRQAGEAEEPVAPAEPAFASASTSAPVAVSDTVLTPEEVDAQIAMKLAALATHKKKAAPIEEFSRAADGWAAKITGPAPLEPVPDTEVRELEEDDLQNIFLEEAREVVHNGLAAIAALEREPGDAGELTVLRRAFHTLKGSSRMVGLTDFGDAAWAFEQVLNTWLADQRPATPVLLAGTGRALRDFSDWVEAIASTQPHAWHKEPFVHAAQQIASGESPTMVAPAAPDAKALAAAARHLAEPSVGRGLPDLPSLDLSPAAEPVSAPSTDDFPSTDFLDFDGRPSRAPAPPGTLEGGEEIDFLATQHSPMEPAFEATQHASFEPAFQPTELAPPQGLANPEPVRPTPAVDTPSEAPDESAPESERPTVHAGTEAEGSPAATEAVAELPASDTTAAESVVAPEALRSVEVSVTVVAEQAADAQEPEKLEAPADVAPVVEAAVSDTAPAFEPAAGEPAAPSDAVKAIGPLRIGIALYNVYLNEADEWSRQLANEVGEWAMEPQRRLPDSTLALAHSLAGSSATVGFQGLSTMARLFEAALAHLQAHGLGTPVHGDTLVAAAEELRRLLHQFAAGFLKEPAEQTLKDLQALASLPVPLPAPVVLAGPLAEPLALVRTAVPKLGAGSADVVLEESDDSIDLQDAIDPDLFPVFEEEAAELLPALGTSLREWVRHPQADGPRAATLRTLHTLKGSARLAGAMRLGERAHRMESAVEALGHDSATAEALEQLLGRFDAMQATFDGLRNADQVAQAEQMQQVLQAAVEPAAHPLADVEVDTGAPSDVPAEGAATAGAAAPPRAAAAATVPLPAPTALAPLRQVASQAVRIRSHLLDRLVMQAGEVIITRARLEAELGQLKSALSDLTGNLDRLRQQLRDVEVQAESQMQSRLAQAKDTQQSFDPLEFDRFTRVQELTRMMAESVNDVATVQRTLQKTIQATEDDLSAQARQTRELQRGLLRTRMVEFDGISERLYRVVRQASKETGKQVRLDITGGTIEMDRGVLDRMTPAFEHLLRNSVAHGIEDAAARRRAGKEAGGLIAIELAHEGNDVSVCFSDDGAGLDANRITERARSLGLIDASHSLTQDEAADMIFRPGFSTAAQVSELAGRGIGMDVVRAEVAALGGRIETTSTPGQGARFKLVLPLTTAVTHVVMLRLGELSVGVPSNLVELVQRVNAADLELAYQSGSHGFGDGQIPLYWAGALLQSSGRSAQPIGKANTVVVVRSAAQRVALHVDEVLGNQEVVVKNLGPQLSRLPGMAGISVLASGAVALIYNPVALAAVHGDAARALQQAGRAASAPPTAAPAATAAAEGGGAVAATAAEAMPPQVPLVLVVDDSITVRRVTQRLLQREGYRVALAADGLQALERLQQERPAVVLSDIEMPRMDGFDLARNIRADEALAGLPIIMITSRIAEKHREHAKQLGVNHYLGKPYSEEELLRLVRSYARAEAPALAG